MAELEEFLKREYLNLYDEVKEVTDVENKVVSLINNSSTSGYFYKPEIGVFDYVIDGEGHVLYLINKSGLPEEIKEGLVGGEAGEKTYEDYASLNDVYGVTKNLKVYYCSNGVDSIFGLGKEELDKDDPFRVVYPKGTPLADIITGGEEEDVIVEDLKNVKDLKIDGSKLASLVDLYNLTSLKSIRISDYNGSLSGIENVVQLSEIFIENSTINDYSAIGKLGKRLEKLYFYNTPNSEIKKLCSKEGTGIGKYDLPNLQYFGIMGRNLIDDVDFKIDGIAAGVKNGKSKNKVSNVLDLDNFSDVTKKAIKYLYLNNNDINSLSGLEDFTNVYALRVEYNLLKTLQGLENMIGGNGKKGLRYLIACNNKLGENETYGEELDNKGKNSETDSLSYISRCKDLYYINVNSNNIKWTDYINNLTSLKEFHIGSNMGICDVPNIKNKLLACSKYTIDNKYLLDLLDEETATELDLKDYTLTLSNLESIKKYTKLTALRLDNIKLAENDGNEISETERFNNTLSSFLNEMPWITDLSLNGITKLNTLSFLKDNDNITHILLLDTNVTDLSVLNNKTKLNTLQINNDNIDLKSIGSTISGCGNREGWSNWVWTNGLIITSQNLIEKLSDCEELTDLRLITNTALMKYTDSDNKIVDLSGCNKLKSFFMEGIHLDFKLPVSIESVRIQYSYNLPDLSLCENLTSIEFYNHVLTPSYEEFVDTIKSMSNCVKLKVLNLKNMYSFSDLSALSYLKDLTNIISIKIGGGQYNYNSVLTSLSGIENLSFLNSIEIIYCNNLEDISKLGNLSNLENLSMKNCEKIKRIPSLMASVEHLRKISMTNCKINDIFGLAGLNLTTLNLSNNEITNLEPLKDMTSLTSLNLVNNALYDRYAYLDEESVQKTGNNIDILVTLNEKGSLRTLKLSGNRGIMEFSKLKNLTWTETDF